MSMVHNTHLFHVAIILHGDNSAMILLINPDQEVLVIVVPDSTSIRPVSGHSYHHQRVEKLVILHD